MLELSEALLESVREAANPEIELAWAEEIKRRVAAYEQGETKTYSAEEVFAEVARLVG